MTNTSFLPFLKCRHSLSIYLSLIIKNNYVLWLSISLLQLCSFHSWQGDPLRKLFRGSLIGLKNFQVMFLSLWAIFSSTVSLADPSRASSRCQ
ncbi:hypothetical protein VIGAN_04068100 [Vigna angularis var. angularis]|uniref:Uncharacterized protein n=1 Tax=Vigna angularis var. angularis TaxID=157739 RepID=A0A0S3RSG1_PHAAN|nr:hypothetical protein VIGAN_04068100 [Vigna angularis var. angularis]